jgi:putative hydrolase of the HAD superfamily
MAVVFDLGAVVLRWRPQVVLSQVLPHRAPTPTDAGPLVDAFFEGFGGDWGEFDRGALEAPELVRRISRRTGLTPEEVAAVVEAIPAELQPMQAMLALMERLRSLGHALYFLSNMPRPYATHLETTYPVYDWFRDGVFSSRVGLIKPEPAIFELARDALALQPALTLFIDDAMPNVAAAREAGWQGLHFRGAEQLERQLAEAGWL